MERSDERVLKDMIMTMVIYGIIAQIICLFIPGDHLRMAAGLWIGVATGIGMAVGIKGGWDEALEFDEGGGGRCKQRT